MEKAIRNAHSMRGIRRGRRRKNSSRKRSVNDSPRNSRRKACARSTFLQ
jgi:hypothetical protein